MVGEQVWLSRWSYTGGKNSGSWQFLVTSWLSGAGRRRALVRLGGLVAAGRAVLLSYAVLPLSLPLLQPTQPLACLARGSSPSAGGVVLRRSRGVPRPLPALGRPFSAPGSASPPATADRADRGHLRRAQLGGVATRRRGRCGHPVPGGELLLLSGLSPSSSESCSPFRRTLESRWGSVVAARVEGGVLLTLKSRAPTHRALRTVGQDG